MSLNTSPACIRVLKRTSSGPAAPPGDAARPRPVSAHASYYPVQAERRGGCGSRLGVSPRRNASPRCIPESSPAHADPCGFVIDHLGSVLGQDPEIFIYMLPVEFQSKRAHNVNVLEISVTQVRTLSPVCGQTP